MYRIDNDTAVTVMPKPAPVGAKHNGYFTKGNPTTATLATIIDDDWCNAIQEEICGVIEAAGLKLDKTNPNQLSHAIEILIQQQIDKYTVKKTPFRFLHNLFIKVYSLFKRNTM